MSKYLRAFYVEVGMKALVESERDTKILCLQRLVRFFAYGSSTLVLTLFLTALGHSTERVGLFMTLTLLGDVLISLVLTATADKIGRRKVLAFGALLMSASGVAFAIFSDYWVLVLASILGVISPSGNEIGPFRAIEESTISQLIAPIDRSSVIAWYSLCGTAGAAAGSIAIGWIVQTLQRKYHWSPVDSYRMVFWIYAGLGLIKLILILTLSSKSEIQAVKRVKKDQSEERRPLLAEDNPPQHTPEAEQEKSSRFRSLFPELSKHTVLLIFKLCPLFALDSFGSGIATNSWMVYFFNNKFGLQEGKLGSLFFVTNILSTISLLAAASLSRRLGLIKTMIFTHLPAALMLIAIPLVKDEAIAMALLLVRSSANTMDQAPRQAFLAAAVQPEERTSVMGVVNVCKTLSQAGGPLISGLFAGIGKLGIAFVIAGCLKAAYDLLLSIMFLGYRTAEERTEVEVSTPSQEDRSEEVERNRGTP